MPDTSASDFPDLFNVSEGIYGAPAYIVLYVIIYGCSSVIGTFGNILIIVITFVSKDLRNNRNAFIVSLSVADLLVSVVIMPASIVGVLMGKKWYEEKPALCLMTSLLCAPSCIVSMHCISWIAISRYYYITKYPTYLKYFTNKRIACYITFVWILGFLVHMPNHFGWGKVRYSFMMRYCSLDTDEQSYAIFYALVLGSGVILAFTFYLKTYLVIRKSKLSKTIIIGKQKSEATQSSNDTSSVMDEIKILKATFKIFILLLISWAPAVFVLFLSMGDKIAPWIYLYAGMFSHIHSTINFLVYFFGNELFKETMRKMFISKFSSQRSICTSYHTQVFKTRL